MIERRSKSLWNWLGLGGWGLGALFAIILIMIFSAMTGLISVGGYSILFFTLLFALWSQAVQGMRRRRAQDVLGYVEQAVKLNVPIPATLIVAEQSERGVIVDRLEKLRNLIDQGEPLGQALADSTPEISMAIARQVSVAERLGQLGRTLAWLRRPRARSQSPEQKAFNSAYLPAMLLAVVGVVGLIQVVILPQYRKILHDFKVPMPWTTGVLAAGFDNAWICWPIGIYVVVYVLVRIGRIISGMFEAEDRYLGRMVDVLCWHLPVLHKRIVNQGMSGLCQVLAGAAAAGWPLEEALREGAQTQSNAVPRKRILLWAQGVESGQSIQEAARAAKMPRLMVGMLGPVRSAEDLAQVMSFLARHYEGRFEKGEILLQAAYIPAVVAVMGFVTAFVAISLLMPMVVLLNHIAAHMPGPVR